MSVYCDWVGYQLMVPVWYKDTMKVHCLKSVPIRTLPYILLGRKTITNKPLQRFAQEVSYFCRSQLISFTPDNGKPKKAHNSPQLNWRTQKYYQSQFAYVETNYSLRAIKAGAPFMRLCCVCVCALNHCMYILIGKLIQTKNPNTNARHYTTTVQNQFATATLMQCKRIKGAPAL